MTSEKGIFFNKRMPSIATLKKRLVKFITFKESLSCKFSKEIFFSFKNSTAISVYPNSRFAYFSFVIVKQLTCVIVDFLNMRKK